MRRLGGWLTLWCLAVIGGASAAHACVPQPLIVLSPQASGPSGSRVTVNGLAVEGTVEIRWNAVDGPQLGEARGPNFSGEVVIPEASEGLHAIIVAERRPDGGLGSTGRAAFYVTNGANSDSRQSTSSRDENLEASAATASGDSSSSPPSAATLLVGGASLVAVGALAGGILTRRHRRNVDQAQTP